MVIWEPSGTSEDRQQRALRMIGYAFAVLAVYLLTQSTMVLAAICHPPFGSRHRVDRADRGSGVHPGGRKALDNPALHTEGRVTTIDGILAVAVLVGLLLNTPLGWW